MRSDPTHPLVDVLGIRIAPLDMEGALTLLQDALRDRIRGYVCFTGVHGIMEAHRDPTLRVVFDSSLLTAPDGMPTVWVGHWNGYKSMRQITGPDLMLQVFARPEFAGRTHFLYGGKPGVAEELQHALEARFPHVRIVGTHTPPFRDLDPTEEDALLATIEDLAPDILWVGISTPRQERFMHRLSPRLRSTLLFGVGAAFDFHTGRIQDCPAWVKRAGLQWFHRLLQDPRHLWRRYLHNNPAFVLHILLQLTGLRSYAASPHTPSPAPVLHKAGLDG
jgi:N-acetylglucosaminyldiphosphoundecaprenol N-acetyl-beta-D-mannosaminyltransferase